MWHNRAANRRTLLPSLGGHLIEHSLGVGLKLRGIFGDIGAQNCSIEGVCLRGELNPTLQHILVRTQGISRLRRTGKGHVVAEIQVVKQVACGTRNQLQRTFRQNPRLQHQTHQGLGDKTSWRCWLDDARHARNK